MTASLEIELAYMSSCIVLQTSVDFSYEAEAPWSGFVRVKLSRFFHNAIFRKVWKVHEILGYR